MDKTYIIANWKLNPISFEEADWLLQAIGSGIGGVSGLGKSIEVVLCPPFMYLSKLNITKQKLQSGAQDCFWADEGAFTGEISPHMLSEIGCSYVILGHSERKNYLGETFEMINKKIKAAITADLIPIVCIGEKEHGENTEEIEVQMRAVLKNIPEEQASKIILAYEPEWAISSNKNAQAASPEDCATSVRFIRTLAKELLGSKEIAILYGGSTNQKNIKNFLDSGVQGALVGSVSLDAEEFIALVKNSV
jgi:triosephosphate isomerase (TIM)